MGRTYEKTLTLSRPDKNPEEYSNKHIVRPPVAVIIYSEENSSLVPLEALTGLIFVVKVGKSITLVYPNK